MVRFKLVTIEAGAFADCVLLTCFRSYIQYWMLFCNYKRIYAHIHRDLPLWIGNERWLWRVFFISCFHL